MIELSIRLVRIALFASAASLVTSYALPSLAQVPVFRQPEPEPPPEPEAGGSAPAAASAPATVPPEPPSAEPPPATPAAPAPGLLSSRTPPAKTDVITEPRLRPDEQDANDETIDARPSEKRKWYGWQTLAADGASVAALSVAVVLSNRAARGSDQKGVSGNAVGLVWFGALGYELAPGIIHFVHKNPGRGFASMGLRLGLPLAGAFLGASAASGCSGFVCEQYGAGLGALLGMGGAIAIDAAVLAYDDPKKPNPRGLSLTPLVAVTRRQAWLGLGGAL